MSQDRGPTASRGDWRTLRDASELTGIPIGTLRKWCRRDTVDSYLESDGELTLRMVEMGSVRARSEALHGEGAKRATSTEEVAGRQTLRPPQTPVTGPEDNDTRVEPPATMIVPVDAWNKMLNQLGNLHEAGQQLAEARERAAKAETEAVFLRERLAEMREVASRQTPVASPEEVESAESSPLPRSGGGAAERSSAAEGAQEDADQTNEAAEEAAETVSFWRYVARGWRGRRR